MHLSNQAVCMHAMHDDLGHLQMQCRSNGYSLDTCELQGEAMFQ